MIPLPALPEPLTMPASATDPSPRLSQGRSGPGEAERAFEALLAEQAGPMAALATRLLGDATEAHDVLQEAWVRAWSHRDALREPGARVGWLRCIVVRECWRALRWRQLRRWLPFGEAVPDLPVPSDPDHALDAARVRRAVAALSPKQRLVWGLRHDEGWTIPEIAAATDLSSETVKTHLSRALSALRAALEPHHA